VIKGLSFWQLDSQPTLHRVPVVYARNKEDTHLKKTREIGFADTRFGGSATAVPAFKVSAKNGLFLGQMVSGHPS
jgi:hypothetical protein